MHGSPVILSASVMFRLKSSRLVVAGFCLLGLTHLTIAQSGSDILQFVDPLIGTANGGHVFAGASLPFGMAKAVADSSTDGQGGFASDGGNITGFSHMHDSGTGGVSLPLGSRSSVQTMNRKNHDSSIHHDNLPHFKDCLSFNCSEPDVNRQYMVC